MTLVFYIVRSFSTNCHLTHTSASSFFWEQLELSSHRLDDSKEHASDDAQDFNSGETKVLTGAAAADIYLPLGYVNINHQLHAPVSDHRI